MVRRIASKRLTTCDVVDDGETVRLDFVDQAGCPVSLELPFGQAESLVMTLLRLLSKALAKRSGDDRCRYVSRWDDGRSKAPTRVA